MAAAIFLSGCSKADVQEETAEATSAMMTTETSASATEVTEVTVTEVTTETTEPPRYEFNPHVHTDLLSETFTDEYWEAFYNLCDAVRAGEDTFECGSKDAYRWATDEVVIGSFMPDACTLVAGDGYKDGKGKIKYKMDKDKLASRQKAFEEEVVKIVNEAVRSDYSDFEKCVAVYDYFCRNFSYDESSIDGATIDEFSTYACLMTKKGICTEIAGAFAYILMQCGVDVVEISEISEMGHAWNYVRIGDSGYNVDATWGIGNKREDGSWLMSYLFETTDERVSDGANRDGIDVDLLGYMNSDYDKSRFVVTDGKYSFLHGSCYFLGMDTKRKVIRYEDSGEVKEYSYAEGA